MTAPTTQRIVAFYDDELTAVQLPDDTIYAVFARLCANLKLQPAGQLQRIGRHEVLQEGLVMLTVETPGGAQQVQCLRIDLVPLWLSGVQTKRITDPQLRDKLLRYQREAAAVLWRAFKPQLLAETAPPPADESGLAIAQLEQIIAQSEAMKRMAEEQITLIRRMDKAALVVRDLQRDVADVQVRLGVLEDKVMYSVITEEQAAELALTVKTVAYALEQRGVDKGYQRVYGEMYRQQGITSYKILPANKFASVMAWLRAWHAEVTGQADAEPL